MTRDQSVISNLKPVTGRVVGGGNGSGLQVHGSGAVNTETVAIPDVWYVPGINCNLVSVGQLCQLGLEVSIFRGVCTVTRASDGSVVGKAHRSAFSTREDCQLSKAPRKITLKPEERANVNVSSLNNIFISAEPGATFPRWFITEAATNHMTSDKSIFSDLKPMAGLVIDDRAGAGAGLPMHGIGAVYSWEVALQDVWYVPGMSAYIGLVSAGQLTAIGLKTEIAGDVCTITSADGSEVGKGRMVVNGYHFAIATESCRPMFHAPKVGCDMEEAPEWPTPPEAAVTMTFNLGRVSRAALIALSERGDSLESGRDAPTAAMDP
ncbi:hypothetical protein OsJ_34818 [Oryza sativa Japonica Group]|uniref:Retrovirus-related Pol polyprotein from transposon TNT 1-94-like beta-barrel domain-containing protein n=1 Tax=Oryza sativa subsp. japonica TaxID=39947 RepID=B9G8U5_ORYSJ|nr:hypothetical protein OsJ_34818 [Oryza sativa Japonica Group]